MADFLRKIAKEREEKRGGKIVQDILPPKSGLTARKKPPLPAIQEKASKEPVKPKIEQKISLPSVHFWKPAARRFNPALLLTRLLSSRRAQIGSAAGILILFTIIFSIVFASTKITIRPIAADLSLSPLSITADPGTNTVDLGAKKIPALKIAVEDTYTATRQSSGKKYVEERATGTIAIFNRFDSNPQNLVRTTRFVDSNGKVFRLVNSVTVPGAKIQGGKIVPSSVDAQVVADGPGQDYNIPPSRFTIPGFQGSPKFEGFYGESRSAMKNGFRGEARVVTAEDIKAGQEEATRRLFEELRKKLDSKIPPGNEFLSLDGSRDIRIAKVVSPKAGERKEEFAIEASGMAEAVVFRKTDLFAFLDSALLSPERPSTILEDTSQIEFSGIQFDIGKDILEFTVKGSATAVRVIPVVEMQALLAGKTTTQAEAFLRGRPEIGGFSIKNSPFWRWKTPRHPEAIEVKVEIPAV
ncbi:MAG: hypothetical protein HYW90_01610 [Candidatus Sungbacteria bacterium]|nr:hypothetical protein [Candidatus Sungbacteria bacterium]